MNYQQLKIRASALGKVMTEPRAKKDLLSKTCTTYLHELYLEDKYSRRREYSSKYIEKGHKMEEDALTLLSLEKKYPFKKNAQNISNDYLTGTPDAYIGKEILQAEHGFDVKCSWDLWTLPKPIDELDKMYYYQNMAYMALTGAQKWTTAYCLINANAAMITREKERIWYALGCPDDSSEEYQAKRIECEKNMIFNITEFLRQPENAGYQFDIEDWQYDIPREERIVEFTTDLDEEVIGAIYQRIRECREYMEQTYGLTKAA